LILCLGLCLLAGCNGQEETDTAASAAQTAEEKTEPAETSAAASAGSSATAAAGTSGSESETSGTCGSRLNWSLGRDGTLTISGSGVMEDYETYGPWHELADSITDLELESGITRIGARAFSDCTELESVTIPDSVRSIGDYAFMNCTGLQSVVIGSGVQEIDEGAFSVCHSLTSITFTGDAPDIRVHCFLGVTATARYPYGNATWVAGLRVGYDGVITWVAY
ncbi:MAG: leucine-rich repeat domain-containing protein, partial [Oscillospiraceae bacterium]|nr:leucine-rich repeat domain-containing protein [Oscillospiraceae bacterium]